MKCPVCVKLGLKSTLTEGAGMSTMMYSAPYYDEDGNYHNHDPNTHTHTLACSNGHKMTVSHKSGCIPCGTEPTERITVNEPEDFEL